MKEEKRGAGYYLQKVDYGINRVLNVCTIIAAICLLIVMMMAVIDVVGTKVFSKPLGMAYEATQMFSLPIVFLATGAVMFGRGPMCIELISQKFPQKLQNIISVFSNLLGLALCSFVFYRQILYTIELLVGKYKTSGTTRIIEWPFCAMLAFGWGTMALACVFCLLRTLFKYKGMPDRTPAEILGEVDALDAVVAEQAAKAAAEAAAADVEKEGDDS